MHTLSFNFMILQICGLWRPSIWSSGWKFVLYNFYTSMIIISHYIFTISELIELFASFDNVAEFAQGSYMLLTMMGVAGKMFVVVKKREEIIELTNVLLNDICKPRNADEMKIQLDCEREARRNSYSYTAWAGTGISLLTLRSFFVDTPRRNLAFKGWLPYHLHESSEIGYWLAYLHQVIAHATGGVVNCSFDTLVPGLMIQACAQMKILKYRLDAIPRVIDERTFFSCDKDNEKREIESLETELLSDSIRHHLEIFQFVDTANDIFGLVVFLQFVVSSIVLCVSVYEISKMNLISAEFAAIAMYVSSMLFQIFFFCFYGGELTLQSIGICDAIYRMEWFDFGIRTRKSLITIMIRSLRPIKFTCANFVVLSLDSFTSLIKLSYSAYNVLTNDR